MKNTLEKLQRSLQAIGRARTHNDGYLLALVDVAEKWFDQRNKEVQKLRKALNVVGDRKKRRLLEQFYLDATLDRAVASRVAYVISQHLQQRRGE